MAKREFIDFGDDGLQLGFNVSETVGRGGKNHRGDVMLIQAMIGYIASSPSVVSGVFGDKNALPEVTGVFNRITAELIKRYQNKFLHVVLAADGIIHPASYKNRVLADRSASRRLMTITLLHEHSNQAAAGLGDLEYTEAVLLKFPQLGGFVA